MNYVKKLLKQIYKKELAEIIKDLRVEYEKNMPPEFLITDHALERMKQRFGCKDFKIRKITRKAWGSKVKVPVNIEEKKRRNPKYKNTIFKQFNGHIFVFSTQYNSKLGYSVKKLITVYSLKS